MGIAKFVGDCDAAILELEADIAREKAKPNFDIDWDLIDRLNEQLLEVKDERGDAIMQDEDDAIANSTLEMLSHSWI